MAGGERTAPARRLHQRQARKGRCSARPDHRPALCPLQPARQPDPWRQAALFPSLYEGFGLPVLEAMMLGTPSCVPTPPRCPRSPATPRSRSTPMTPRRSPRACVRSMRMRDCGNDLTAVVWRRPRSFPPTVTVPGSPRFIKGSCDARPVAAACRPSVHRAARRLLHMSASGPSVGAIKRADRAPAAERGITVLPLDEAAGHRTASYARSQRFADIFGMAPCRRYPDRDGRRARHRDLGSAARGAVGRHGPRRQHRQFPGAECRHTAAGGRRGRHRHHPPLSGPSCPWPHPAGCRPL